MDPRAEKDTVAWNIGRYVLFREVAHGGMATVHLGRLRGVGGFARTVAIKRLHPQFARDPEFVSMFLDEARLAARIQHPNVVSVLDVVASERELFLVMDYVHGEALSKLLKRARANGIAVPANVVCAILLDLLYGLHAAHEALSERGDPLNMVHRDVSPQNVLVGVDGIARVLDFGIAKAAQRANASTRTGQLKGKLAYMAPEQVSTGAVDRRADVYSAAVVLWEALTGERLFPALDTGHLIAQILTRDHKPPSESNPDLPAELDAIVLRGLARKPEDRYASAQDMAADLERAAPPATPRVIGEWVTRIAGQALTARAVSIAEIETATLSDLASERNSPLAAFFEPAPAPATSPAARDSARAPDVIEFDVEVDGGVQAARAAAAPYALHAALPLRRARAWWVAAGAAAVSMLCTVVIGVRLAHGDGKSGAERRPAPETATLLEPPRAATKLPTRDVVVANAPSNAADAVPSAGTPGAAEAANAASLASAPPAASRAAQTATPPAANTWRGPAPRNDCTPPYVTDKAGVRVPKRWCF
jgi:serine/threonine-protein kinase